MEQRQLDRALTDACLAGSAPAWARLVEENREHVRFAIRRTARRHGACASEDFVDDLESALFLRLVVDDFRRLRLYRGDASLRGWLKVLASNATVDALRKRRPTVPLGPGETLDLPASSPLPSELVERAQLAARLRTLWQSLSESDASFVEMFFIQERSFEDIAAETGASAGSLYARKNRIRKKLIQLAEEDGWFDVKTA